MKQMETQKNHLPDTAVDLSMALLINGKSLEPQPIKHSTPVERKFKSEKEFNELVVDNSKILFGQNTIMIDATKSSLECHLLLDFREAEKHRIYFVDITLSKFNFWELFIRVTGLFTLLNSQDYQSRLTEVLMGITSENRALKKELNLLVGEDIDEYFKVVVLNKPCILLFTDQERPELDKIMTTYSDNWGRLVKSLLIRKYADNGDLFCVMCPAFIDVDLNTNEKVTKADRQKQTKSTEADHLENATDIIRSVYQKIKTDLLKEDAGIEFNVKQYYVSMRKDKNLAFFHIGKKRISLVVMCPEKDTKKQIKNHEVKTLTEKVQKFWNGASCTIMLDNTEHLDEVINLLKKLVAKS